VAQQQTVYVLDSLAEPKPVRVTLGITDGKYIAVMSGELAEGQPVVVGAKMGAASTQPQAGTSTRRFGF
jgi:multidrug efflux pump subunit AcrA (membrane-fusion protein)